MVQPFNLKFIYKIAENILQRYNEIPGAAVWEGNLFELSIYLEFLNRVLWSLDIHGHELALLFREGALMFACYGPNVSLKCCEGIKTNRPVCPANAFRYSKETWTHCLIVGISEHCTMYKSDHLVELGPGQSRWVVARVRFSWMNFSRLNSARRGGRRGKCASKNVT